MTTDPVGGTQRGSGRYSVPEAARVLGISERAVRKRIVAGSLDAERDGHQWIVFLPAELDPEPGGPNGPDAVPGGTSAAELGGTRAVPAEALSDLVALVERQQQTIMELSGRCGWLQARLEDAQAQLALRSPDSDAERPPRRSWRRLWRWLGT